MKGSNKIRSRVISTLLISLIIIGNMATRVYAKDEDGNFTSIEKGEQYLEKSQKQNGGWSDNITINVLSTTEILNTYETKENREDLFGKAKDCLENEEYNNFDLKARAIPFLSDSKKDGFIQEIIMNQNSDGGFGVNKGYGSDVIDTAIITKALMAQRGCDEVLAKAIHYIISKQNSDGSWSEYVTENGSIYVTGLIRSILYNFQEDFSCNLSEYLNKSAQWLSDKKNLLYTENANNAEDYYSIYFGLYKDHYDQVDSLIKEVENKQNDNGSWNNNPYDTALMIQLIKKDKMINVAKIEDIILKCDGQNVDQISANKTLQIIPKYQGVNCSIKVNIYDLSGNTYETYTINNDKSYYWDVALNGCGDYKVEVVIKDKEGTIKDLLQKNIKVLPYIKSTKSIVQVNPYVSIKGNQESVSVKLLMDAETNITDKCTINTSIVNSKDKVILDKNIEKEIINGNNDINVTTFDVDATMGGIYKIKVSVKYGNSELMSSTTNYRVVEKSKSLYTDNIDFDKGIMDNVSYFDAKDQLQLSKQHKDFYSTFFTIKDIVLFGYEDGTYIHVYDQDNNLKWEGELDKGKQKNLNVSRGLYKVSSNKKLSILTGDPISSYVSGYYAMDNEGYGAGKEIYTWVPQIYSYCKFIVFAMEDNTDVEVRDNSTNQLIWSGVLNKGAHWENSSLSSKYIHIIANKRVSALTDYDQSYYVPSVNGNWSGAEFYTHVGNTGNWAHDLTIASYSDNNNITVINTSTGEVVWSGVLSYGNAKVLSYPNGTDKYFTIKSSNTVTVCVQPWVSMTSSYSQGVYVADKEGIGLGKEFIATSLGNGNLYVLSYKEGTNIEVYNSKTGVFIKSYSLKSGEYIDVNPGNGLWLIKSNKDISVYSGYGSASAGFTPVEFGGMVMAKEGSWNVINEGDKEDYYWSKIVWTEEKPEGTHIIVKARTANSLDKLENTQYIEVENGLPNENLKGKFIQVQVELSTNNVSTPILKDVFIGQETEYNSRIIADAGEDQYISAGSTDGEEVVLDGSKSYDSNGKSLIYKWSWDGGEAEGARPTIKLKEGVTEISLKVSNGETESLTDNVKVYVYRNKINPIIETDKKQYSTFENMKIKLHTELLSSSNKIVKGVVQITDSNDNIVEVIDDKFEEQLTVGIPNEKNYVWNTKKYMNGKYKIKVSYYDGNTLISEGEKEFSITADGQANNTVFTDKKSYSSNEKVNISTKINNTSNNSVQEGLKLVTKVVDKDEKVVFSETKDLESILQNAMSSKTTSWDIGNSNPGKYTVISSVLKNEQEISNNKCEFDVLSSEDNYSGISGEINLSKDSISSNDTLNISTKINNKGNADLVDVKQKIQVINTKDNSVVYSLDSTSKLNKGDSDSKSFDWIAENLEEGTYIVTYSMIKNDGTSIYLDGKYFKIESIRDDFEKENDLWNYMGCAHRSDKGYAVLTENQNNQTGAMWLKKGISMPFVTNFKYKAGGGTGADGFIFMFAKKANELGNEGREMGFKSGNGYGIEFDSFYNKFHGEQTSVNRAHIALGKDLLSTGNKGEIIDSLAMNVTESVASKLNDNQWHDVQVRVTTNGVQLYLDGERALVYKGKIDASYDGFGFSAATGTQNSSQYIDNVVIKENTEIKVDDMNDDFSEDNNKWRYMGSAYRSKDGYAVLTDNKTWQAGAMWLNDVVAAPFTTRFKYKTGGGNGADGLVFMFGKEPDKIGSNGGALGFAEGNGYGLEFDSFFNTNQVENSTNKGKHLALIKDRLTIPSLKINANKAVTDKLSDNQWHNVEVRVKKDGIEVFIDGDNVMNWYGTIDKTYSGFGFAAATGGYTDSHFIDDVQIKENVEEHTDSIKDDFSIDSGLWNYMGSAKRKEDDTIQLTANESWKVGAAWLNKETSNKFTTKFKYKSGNGSTGKNGDGFTYMFYKNPNQLGSSGESLGFTAGNGYGLEFDSFYNSSATEGISNNSPHIALVKNSIIQNSGNGKMLAYNNNPQIISKLTDNSWHDVQISVTSESVQVYIDDTLIIDYKGILDTTYTGTGFSAATGQYNQSNYIDDFDIDIER